MIISNEARVMLEDILREFTDGSEEISFNTRGLSDTALSEVEEALAERGYLSRHDGIEFTVTRK